MFVDSSDRASSYDAWERFSLAAAVAFERPSSMSRKAVQQVTGVPLWQTYINNDEEQKKDLPT
jgi:hypothetical protein